MAEKYDIVEEGCDTTECAEKAEAMLSTAIMQQQDIWNLLMLSVSEPGISFNPGTGDMSAVAQISLECFFTMKGKLENSIDWCSLAQSRLKGIISPDPRRLTPSLKRRPSRLGNEKELR